MNVFLSHHYPRNQQFACKMTSTAHMILVIQLASFPDSQTLVQVTEALVCSFPKYGTPIYVDRQNTMILIVGAPKFVPLILGSPNPLNSYITPDSISFSIFFSL